MKYKRGNTWIRMDHGLLLVQTGRAPPLRTKCRGQKMGRIAIAIFGCCVGFLFGCFAGYRIWRITKDEPLTQPEPLSLEQLKQMDEEPVWVEKLSSDSSLSGTGWAIVEPCLITHLLKQNSSFNVWWFGSEVEDNPSYKDYGKTWVAYARKPRGDRHYANRADFMP